MPRLRRRLFAYPVVLSSVAVAVGACATSPGEPLDDVGSVEQPLAPVCVTIQRGAAGDVGDTFLSGDYPTWAPGAEPGVWTGISSGGNFNQALYSFDLTPIPPDATVTSATFSVYQAWSANYNQVGVHRVTAPWLEATVTGANFDPAAIEFAAQGSFAAGGVGIRSVDLSALVQDWVSGATPNHGVALVESPVNRHYFFTSEAGSTALRPSLQVCYTEGSCDDGVQSAGEVGVDCGGSCPPCVCTPGSTAGCYTGPVGTQGVGACAAGTQTCNAEGSAYGPCVGDVVPATESCATAADDDCDGQANEGCVCTPNVLDYCYTGPAGTLAVGLCAAGTHQCNAAGTAWGACTGQVLPATESCATGGDDDCDGQTNEGCVCTPLSTQACYSGPVGTAGVGICKAGTRTCNSAGTAWGSCTGEVLPATETCNNGTDDDCDGTANENCAAATCTLYSENFDDGNATEVTSGAYKIGWCDTYIPVASNTPLCMLGQTLRTNDSTIDPTIWVSRGSAPCTSAKITYSYYQFAAASTTLTYQRSNDASEVCEKTGTFTSLLTHPTTQACVSQNATVTFNGNTGIYFRFEHGTGTNALWVDNISVELQGCSCP